MHTYTYIYIYTLNNIYVSICVYLLLVEDRCCSYMILGSWSRPGRHGWHGGLHVAHRRHRDAIFVHFWGGLEICCFLVYIWENWMKFRDLLGVWGKL